MLFSRGAGLLGVAAITAGLLLPTEGLGVDACMLHRATGLPCPGCGLTRSVTNILHGEFARAWAYNPFGFVFAAFFVALAGGLAVPRAWVRRWEVEPPVSDRVMGVGTGVLVLLMMAFGLGRMWSMRDLPRYSEWWKGPPPPGASAEP